MITEVCITLQTKHWSVRDVSREQRKILPLGWGMIIQKEMDGSRRKW